MPIRYTKVKLLRKVVTYEVVGEFDSIPSMARHMIAEHGVRAWRSDELIHKLHIAKKTGTHIEGEFKVEGVKDEFGD